MIRTHTIRPFIAFFFILKMTIVALCLLLGTKEMEKRWRKRRGERCLEDGSDCIGHGQHNARLEERRSAGEATQVRARGHLGLALEGLNTHTDCKQRGRNAHPLGEDDISGLGVAVVPNGGGDHIERVELRSLAGGHGGL